MEEKITDINLFRTKNSFYLKKIRSKNELNEKDECDGYLIESSEKEARRIIESLKGKKIIAIVGDSDAFNRRAIETLKINYLVSPEKNTEKNSLKQRDSGLNDFLAKEAKKRNISIVINLSELAKFSKEEKIKVIAKIIQNVKICRKTKCPIKIVNFSTEKNFLINEIGRKSLGFSFGMSSEQAKKCVVFD